MGLTIIEASLFLLLTQLLWSKESGRQLPGQLEDLDKLVNGELRLLVQMDH